MNPSINYKCAIMPSKFTLLSLTLSFIFIVMETVSYKETMSLFKLKIDDDLELRLLEERHAEELFALTDQNRAYLREWLPWLDNNRSLSDTKEFIKNALKQFANNNGF